MPSTITTPIVVRLDNDIIAQLDALAEQQSISRSAIARTALAAGLAALRPPVQESASAPKVERRRARKKPTDQESAPASSASTRTTQTRRSRVKPLSEPSVALPLFMETEVAERAAPRSSRGKKVSKGGGAKVQPQAGPDLATFAARVLEAGQKSRTGRFGDDRVFISHVWRQYKREQRPKGMDLDSFKKRLVEANRERCLSLVCADMAPFLPQKDVQESETRYLSATFHLLCI